jgi:predicted  nucleic acid-binding Zn-ribbon protein
MIKSKFLLCSVVVFAFASIFLSSAAFADVISPHKQIQLKISVSKVSCKEGLIKVIKTSDDKPACVKPSSVEKLVDSGWAKPVDPKLIVSATERSPLGDATVLSIVKEFGSSGRLDTSPRTVGYVIVFDACAFDKTIRAPQVLVNSDSESKNVQLASMIPANSCQTNSINIKAMDTNSIKVILTNKGGITDTITTLENKISDLLEKINQEKKKISEITNIESTESTKQDITTASNTLVDLRTQLNTAKSDYNTYLFALLAEPVKLAELRTPVSFEGSKIDGVRITTVTSYQQINSQERPFGYNVLFEVCSDLQTIRLPQVKVTSDTETIIVKLADKIPTKTCQKSIAKIKAYDITKLTYELGTSNDVSAKIDELQMNLDTQQKTLASIKQELSELTHKAQKPDDYEQKVTELSNKITDLRNKINSNKEQLARYQFQFYLPQ